LAAGAAAAQASPTAIAAAMNARPRTKATDDRIAHRLARKNPPSRIPYNLNEVDELVTRPIQTGVAFRRAAKK
jgi:hypothetical protein